MIMFLDTNVQVILKAVCWVGKFRMRRHINGMGYINSLISTSIMTFVSQKYLFHYVYNFVCQRGPQSNGICPLDEVPLVPQRVYVSLYYKMCIRKRKISIIFGLPSAEISTSLAYALQHYTFSHTRYAECIITCFMASIFLLIACVWVSRRSVTMSVSFSRPVKRLASTIIC